MSLLGLAVAAWLTYAHYTTPAALACPDTGIVNCAKVTTSSYSVVLGVPVAVAGLAWFALTAALQSPWAWRSSARALTIARLATSGAGVAMVLWLLYAELFRLDAICLYCSIIHGFTLALFITTILGTTRAGEAPSPAPDSAG